MRKGGKMNGAFPSRTEKETPAPTEGFSSTRQVIRSRIYDLKDARIPPPQQERNNASAQRHTEHTRERDEMVVVLFEVTVKEEGRAAYLALAAGLKEELEHAEGFIRSERFTSLVNEGKILSLSVWESEEAVEKWRTAAKHRMSQRQGHDSLFASYTLTVASTIRSYTQTEREEAPKDSTVFFA